MMNPMIYVLFLMVLVIADLSQAQSPAGSKELPNFSVVNNVLYRGGQPTEEGFKRLAKMGVKTVINLRGDEEHSKIEAGWAKNNGLKFINVDLSNWFKPKTEDIETIIRDINETQNQPVFVHCKRGSDRTGVVIAIYRITHDGWTAKQAIDEAKKSDFGWWQFWMKDYINDYYRDYMARKK